MALVLRFAVLSVGPWHDPGRALAWYRRSLRLKRELNDAWSLALLYDDLGRAYRELEAYHQALTAFDEALAIWRSQGQTARAGTILHVRGQTYLDLGRHARAAADFRGANLGFIFQDFNLIPVLSAAENIEYPLLMVQNRPAAERRARVAELLEAVGMAEQATKRPDQLSGGQKQRVAVARALATKAKLVLADEPTANLDHDTAYRILGLMKKMRDEQGTTFVFSTHDPKIVNEAEVILTLEDGRLVSHG